MPRSAVYCVMSGARASTCIRGMAPTLCGRKVQEPIKAFSPVKDVSPPLKSPERGAEPLMLENVAAATDVM